MPEVRVKPARLINNLRNKFAHRDKEDFQHQDIVDLQKAIEDMIAKPIPSHFAIVNKSEDSSREWQFEKMSLKEKFCLMGFLALASIATIENDFKKLCFKSRSTTQLV
ncbi:hypothetical protein [Tardiphaga robiniae]|uniref:Uncharacterized protein n=1 Tax=Tardiphaga robiniae TaxID=943830 RepID=A0A7G6TVP4_9BRAD|nr:hypothetical protein [Tardiphaga robiniae]QND70826.1 hypothetical protein HB776_05935 [Tardiphaga robiniae]